jgi:hypothetical protein
LFSAVRELPFSLTAASGTAAGHIAGCPQATAGIGAAKSHATSIETATRLGCGYDFRLNHQTDSGFLAVEVKGLKETSGSLSLTPKEHEVASSLAGRFFLFVVKNFRESPYHEIYPNPLVGSLRFTKKERVIVHTSWLANI